MKKVSIAILTIVFLFMGCSSNTFKDVVETDPDTIAIQYAEAIANKDAVKIVQLYGGDYEFMEIFSEEQYRGDKEKIVENYLKVIPEKIYFNEIVSKNVINNQEIEYEITFKMEDGSLFDVGDTETRNSIFKYTVKKIDGEFKVMEVPPYQP